MDAALRFRKFTLPLPDWFGRRSALRIWPEAEARRSLRTLARDVVLVVPRPRGGSVVCKHGSALVTQLGDCKDVVLASGRTHRIDRSTQMAIRALEDSILEFIDLDLMD